MAEMAKVATGKMQYAMNYEEYEGVENIIDHVRFMRSYFNEVVDEDPKTRQFLPELHCAYMDRLNVLFAPHAFDLAAAVVAWEDRAAAVVRALRRIRFAAVKAAEKPTVSPTAEKKRAPIRGGRQERTQRDE